MVCYLDLLVCYWEFSDREAGLEGFINNLYELVGGRLEKFWPQ